jgi:hypothetical protein
MTREEFDEVCAAAGMVRGPIPSQHYWLTPRAIAHWGSPVVVTYDGSPAQDICNTREGLETALGVATVNALRAEVDALRLRVAELDAGAVAPLREWTDNQQRIGSVHPGALLDGHRFVGLRLCLATRGQETLHQLTPTTARGIAAALMVVADAVGDV